MEAPLEGEAGNVQLRVRAGDLSRQGASTDRRRCFIFREGVSLLWPLPYSVCGELVLFDVTQAPTATEFSLTADGARSSSL
jgi:hypothetical protein